MAAAGPSLRMSRTTPTVELVRRNNPVSKQFSSNYNPVRSKCRRSRFPGAVTMSLESIGADIEEFARMPTTVPVAERRDAATRVLKALDENIVRVRGRANNYPANPIQADVWVEGAALGPLAERLASLLRTQGLTDLEEAAHTLRGMAVLAVQSHYHYLVGPAMLARAECNERLGRAELAGELYECVVGDFRWILDEWSPLDEAPNCEDRISLECLLQALRGVLKHRPAGTDPADAEALLRRCGEVLARKNAG
jgi:hypothetical protein